MRIATLLAGGALAAATAVAALAPAASAAVAQAPVSDCPAGYHVAWKFVGGFYLPYCEVNA
ncbi:hypothetical protein ACQEU3_44715 [Spirillospora sp. CA-253888]